MATKQNTPRTPAGKTSKVHRVAKAVGVTPLATPESPVEMILPLNTKGTDGQIMDQIIVDVDSLVMLNQYRTVPVEPKALAEWDADIAELAENIKAEGLLQPISVRREGGQWVVVFGHRRVLACRLAGIKRIPAVVDTSPLVDVMARQINENRLRKNPPLLDTARGCRQMWEVMPHPKAKNAAAKLGIKPDAFSKLLLLTDEHKAGAITIKAVAEGKIKEVETGYTLAKIEEIDPTEAQAVVNNYEKETRASVQARYKALKKSFDEQQATDENEETEETVSDAANGPDESLIVEDVMTDDEIAYQEAVDFLASGQAREIVDSLVSAVPRLPRGMGAKLAELMHSIEVLEQAAMPEGEGEDEEETTEE